LELFSRAVASSRIRSRADSSPSARRFTRAEPTTTPSHIPATRAACSPLANIDREIERLKEFEAAGLTDIALRVYGDAKEAIRIIGEHVLPEFDKPAQAA
jgi:hypothetical protein